MHTSGESARTIAATRGVSEHRSSCTGSVTGGHQAGSPSSAILTTEDATYAVDSLNVDGNQQAAKAAKEHLAVSAYSRGGLIDQLVYEGYTSAQAQYGVAAVGL